jgi:purine-binding chemotaxis protein CheW
MNKEFVTVTVAEQLFGIPVLTVQDVLSAQTIARIPLAPAEVAGSLNLRGRIVTAIDLRTCLAMPMHERPAERMSVVVERAGNLYSLLVDTVGEVLSVDEAVYERNPVTLDPSWREVSDGVYRLDGQLLVVLDVDRLLRFTRSAEAA